MIYAYFRQHRHYRHKNLLRYPSKFIYRGKYKKSNVAIVGTNNLASKSPTSPTLSGKKSLKPPSDLLVKAFQLIDLFNEEDQLWFEEKALEEKKRDLERRTLEKIEEIQKTGRSKNG